MNQYNQSNVNSNYNHIANINHHFNNYSNGVNINISGYDWIMGGNNLNMGVGNNSNLGVGNNMSVD